VQLHGDVSIPSSHTYADGIVSYGGADDAPVVIGVLQLSDSGKCLMNASMDDSGSLLALPFTVAPLSALSDMNTGSAFPSLFSLLHSCALIILLLVQVCCYCMCNPSLPIGLRKALSTLSGPHSAILRYIVRSSFTPPHQTADLQVFYISVAV
jgi:hypothetical protein